ncbi:MAG: hypothetical protein Q4D48_00380 [Coriobacteriales bacterium]|nr:hypothetical protein [Coriobacteriales bacterium]
MSFLMPSYREPDFACESLASAPNAQFVKVTRDGVAPRGFHSTSMHPEYYKVNGSWVLAEHMMMDDVVRLEADGSLTVLPARDLHAGDLVAVGRYERGEEGILVWSDGFAPSGKAVEDQFSFRQGRSRETSYARDYDQLVELLQYEREHGNILWVAGPAFTFDAEARNAMSAIINAGYAHGLMGGNALATHDLEGALLHTALGQDIYTQVSQPGGHYNHMDVINEVRLSGSIRQFITDNDLNDGIMCALERRGIPYVLAGSIRDDGPLPEVIGDAYDAQDAMHGLIKNATTIICMATMLHSIATGNMAPSYHVLEDGSVRPVLFYAVDATEFAVNKLRDRGSLSATTIVANAHDFITRLARGLGLSW